MVWAGTQNHGFSNRPYSVCRYVHVCFSSAPTKNKLFIVRYLSINFAITLKSPIWEYTYTILIKVVKHGMERSLQMTARCDIGQPGTVNLQLTFSNSIWNVFCNIPSFCFGIIDIVLALHRCDGELMGCTSVSLELKNWLNTSAGQAKNPTVKLQRAVFISFQIEAEKYQ